MSIGLRTFAIGFGVIALSAVSVRASGTLEIVTGEVIVICPLTVGGSFEARTKDVTGALSRREDAKGAIAGAVRVNLQTLETGIGLRDDHMKTRYLEVNRGADFATAAVTDIELDALDGRTAFRGMLSLHGEVKPVAGIAHVRFRDGRYRIEAEFPLRVSDFHISSPKYLGIGVRDDLRVTVKLVVTEALQLLPRTSLEESAPHRSADRAH